VILLLFVCGRKVNSKNDLSLLTESQHVENHDKNERYQSEERCYIRQDTLCGIHLIEDIAKASREEDG